MPVSYTIDIAGALVLSRGWGVVTGAELVAHARALAADPRFHPALPQVFDLRDATRGEVDRATILLLASLSPFGQGARRAIVAPGDLAYGLSRMFEMLREPFLDEIHVYHTITEACAWLGLSPEQPWEAAAQRPPDWSTGNG